MTTDLTEQLVETPGVERPPGRTDARVSRPAPHETGPERCRQRVHVRPGGRPVRSLLRPPRPFSVSPPSRRHNALEDRVITAAVALRLSIAYYNNIMIDRLPFRFYDLSRYYDVYSENCLRRTNKIFRFVE